MSSLVPFPFTWLNFEVVQILVCQHQFAIRSCVDHSGRFLARQDIYNHQHRHSDRYQSRSWVSCETGCHSRIAADMCIPQFLYFKLVDLCCHLFRQLSTAFCHMHHRYWLRVCHSGHDIRAFAFRGFDLYPFVATIVLGFCAPLTRAGGEIPKGTSRCGSGRLFKRDLV